MKNKFKRGLKKAGKVFLTGLTIGAMYVGNVFGDDVDLKLDANNAVTRANLTAPNANVTLMNVNGDKQNSIRTTFDKDFLKGKGYITAKADRARNDDGEFENSYTIAPAFAKDGVFVKPYFNFNKNFDMTDVDPFIQVNTKAKGMDIQTAYFGVIPKEGEASNAFYFAANNDKLGIGATKHYDDSYSLMTGADLGKDIGATGDIKVNPEDGDWAISGVVAQDPNGSVGPAWPKLYGDYLGIGRGSDVMPYFTATGNKSKGGLVGKLKVTGNNSTIGTGRAELGYKIGNFALTGGYTQDFSNDDGNSDITATYTTDEFTAEGNINDEGDAQLYIKLDW